jgi:multimeric flavodoxin WrbA
MLIVLRRRGEAMAVKVAIIYYSATGITYQLARAVEEGARGAEVRFRKVHELTRRSDQL